MAQNECTVHWKRTKFLPLHYFPLMSPYKWNILHWEVKPHLIISINQPFFHESLDYVFLPFFPESLVYVFLSFLCNPTIFWYKFIHFSFFFRECFLGCYQIKYQSKIRYSKWNLYLSRLLSLYIHSTLPYSM